MSGIGRAGSGADHAIRVSTAAAVLGVAVIAAYLSYEHAYAVVRAHGETGMTARLEPATIDGLVYSSSMVILYAARHRLPGTSPGPLPARARHRRYPGRERGPWLVPRPDRFNRRRLARRQPRRQLRTPAVDHPDQRGPRAGRRAIGGPVGSGQRASRALSCGSSRHLF